MREVLSAALDAEIRQISSVSGGDVAESFRLELDDGRTLFAKTHRSPPANFFSTEAWGLAWLRDAGATSVPTVVWASDDPPWLVLEWIDEGGRRNHQTESDLGTSLARVHQAGAPCFGREDRRTTGSRGLPNEPCESWSQFYATQRLLPLADLAERDAALPAETIGWLRALADHLDDLGVPDEPPARLHGDLWAGNRLVDLAGQNWLIDPAAHGGHREFDLAMMRLFGGFSEQCFVAYHDIYPLADGWRDRMALHQIAPLVVHAIKFGGGYVSAATGAIGKYR